MHACRGAPISIHLTGFAELQVQSPDKAAAARVKTLARLIQGNGANKEVLHNSGEQGCRDQLPFYDSMLALVNTEELPVSIVLSAHLSLDLLSAQLPC